MNLVSGYSNPYYPGTTHIASHPHEFYTAQPNMGMSRYQWHGGHTDAPSTDPWTLQHPHHSIPQATMGAQHIPGEQTPLTIAINGGDNFQGQYNSFTGAAPNGYENVPIYDVMPDGTVKVRVVKRRNCANKKERRRTISINTAFSSLRGCIPNVPSDTKLSKIKTLRLATSYIAYLMDILNKDDPTLTKGGFKAEISKKIEGREERRKREVEEMLRAAKKEETKKAKGRTGWPQAVWASELKPEANTSSSPEHDGPDNDMPEIEMHTET